MYNRSFVFRSESHIVSRFDYQAFHIMARNIRRTPWETLKEFFQETVPEEDAVPGAVIFIQSF